jgi:hypothetical protein
MRVDGRGAATGGCLQSRCSRLKREAGDRSKHVRNMRRSISSAVKDTSPLAPPLRTTRIGLQPIVPEVASFLDRRREPERYVYFLPHFRPASFPDHPLTPVAPRATRRTEHDVPPGDWGHAPR